MKKLAMVIVVTTTVLVGVVYALRPQGQVLGAAWPEDLERTSIGSLSAEMDGQMVRIEGTIVVECPHTGCWAVVQDDSGQVRIDTTGGGFALPLRREGSRIKVAGTVKVKPNGDVDINAVSAML